MLKKAYLEISNVCNLSCRFCPSTKREARIMTPAEFHVLAERLRKHTEYLYLHLMGEPLLHPQLEGAAGHCGGAWLQGDNNDERDAASGARRAAAEKRSGA